MSGMAKWQRAKCPNTALQLDSSYLSVPLCIIYFA